MENKKQIFKKSSTTYYYSSLFFPKNILDKIATIYAYVRVADNFVDDYPQDINGYKQFISQTNKAFRGNEIDKEYKYSTIIVEFVTVAKRFNFKKKWINAFHQSMISDISKDNKKIIYQTKVEIDNYIFGSAEVIGLFIVKVLNLPKASLFSAMKQGHAMQKINFIRDIAEDCQLNRQYLTEEQLEKFNVNKLCQKPQNNGQLANFKKLIRSEITDYYKIQKQAELGYKYIPYRYRLPIATAASLYKWTAKVIYNNPLIIFEKKVKPTKQRVILTFFKQAIKWI